MMDLNYFGHDFINREIRDLPNDYICKICKIRVFVNRIDEIEQDNTVYTYKHEKLDLSCAEVQIKKLLE